MRTVEKCHEFIASFSNKSEATKLEIRSGDTYSKDAHFGVPRKFTWIIFHRKANISPGAQKWKYQDQAADAAADWAEENLR